MHFTQGDLFWGMDIGFVRNVTEIAVPHSCKKGEKLFEIGDSADHFYVLLKGNVLMQRGDESLYTATHPGEIFGWSALIKREKFAAAATCSTDVELLKIERDPFLAALEIDPKNKALLFERLAKMLGNQLLEVYISITC